MLLPEIFRPVADPSIDLVLSANKESLASRSAVYTVSGTFPDIDEARVAILGVPEYRGSFLNRDMKSGLSDIREKLYRLHRHAETVKLVDLGDLIPGETLQDTYAALESVLFDLISKNVIPLVLGGSQDLSLAFYNAYKRMEKVINIVGIDARFDLGLPDDPSGSNSWLGKIVMQQPNYLFNFSNLGYQTYFVGAAGATLMERLFFDAHRLGQLRADITEMEPVIRSADMVTFDLSSIRQADAPGNTQPSPNGFAGEEACQAMFYSGVNDRLTALGIFEMDYAADRGGQTAHLVAQMIWYFLEGVANRKNDIPHPGHDGFTTYRVTLDKTDILFLKNQNTGRWWIEVPLAGKNNRYRRHNFLPCSQKDYQQACDNEMPDRYWQALQKMV
ncbi:MAG TPA: formimidoylglutamase [Bacteroidia bacterium]|nr:formimidoylglutamase [Bacteroidia bacterium]